MDKIEHAESVELACTSLICSECIMKIPPVSLIMVAYITYFMLRFILRMYYVF